MIAQTSQRKGDAGKTTGLTDGSEVSCERQSKEELRLTPECVAWDGAGLAELGNTVGGAA